MVTSRPFTAEFVDARKIGGTGVAAAGNNPLGDFNKSWICA
jgi:hypothetical protein